MYFMIICTEVCRLVDNVQISNFTHAHNFPLVLKFALCQEPILQTSIGELCGFILPTTFEISQYLTEFSLQVY